MKEMSSGLLTLIVIVAILLFSYVWNSKKDKDKKVTEDKAKDDSADDLIRASPLNIEDIRSLYKQKLETLETEDGKVLFLSLRLGRYFETIAYNEDEESYRDEIDLIMSRHFEKYPADFAKFVEECDVWAAGFTNRRPKTIDLVID